MNIKPIPVIRAAYLNKFKDVLHDSGTYYETELHHFNLPTTLADRPGVYVPLKAAMSFVHWMELSCGIEDFGLRAGSQLKIADFDIKLYNMLRCVPTLEGALQAFCILADREHSGGRFRLVREHNEVRIYNPINALLPSKVVHCHEWLQIMSLLTIIRHFAGNSWTPGTIVFQSQHAPGQHARHLFPRTRFITGQRETGIVFPVSLLSIANTTHSDPHPATSILGGNSAVTGTAVWDFPTSLRKVLQAYLNDELLDINRAATIIGSSVRTMQRKLSCYNLTYSNLIHQAQFEYASELLANPRMRILDIAYTVGYQDPSNFSRAFRYLSSMTPREYRKRMALRIPGYQLNLDYAKSA